MTLLITRVYAADLNEKRTVTRPAQFRLCGIALAAMLPPPANRRKNQSRLPSSVSETP